MKWFRNFPVKASKTNKNLTILNYKNLDELNTKFFTHQPSNIFLTNLKRSKVKSQERQEVLDKYVDKEIKQSHRPKFSLSATPKFQIEDKWMNEKCAKLISK